MKDQAIVVEALNEASRMIAEYLEPGPRNAEVTVNRLIQALDNGLKVPESNGFGTG
jgi:hypothetical protein